MKYNEFVSSNHNFQSSVNLQYDLNKEQKIVSYIPTKQSLTILKRYLNAVYNDSFNEDNATVLIGPYGRGKSHLLLVLSAIISAPNPDDVILNELVQKLSENDCSTAELARMVLLKKKPMLPVLINSNHTDIKQSFLIALREALERAELSDFFPETYFDSALRMIDTWENEFENAIKSFKKELKEYKIKLEDLKDQLHKCDATAYQIFCQIYPIISNGAEFNPLQNTDIVKMYQQVATALEEQKNYSGIYIIFDEFSKFLESAAAMSNMQNLKLIQDFAELATRSNQIHICCITHKEILDYSQSDSFRTVDGRFKKVYFIASSEQSYELVANAITHNDEFESFYTEHLQDFNNMANHCHLTGLFNDLSDDTFSEIVVKKCFPLHPISVYSLIRISETVGQNERSLFTFLSQSEEYAFQSFINRSVRRTELSFLTPDWLFDYFSELFRVEIFNPRIHSIWAKAKSALSKCEDAIQQKIVKILAISKIIHNDIFIANDMNVKVSANVSDDEYCSAIAFLSSNHIITMRRDGVYAFLTPNGVDIRKNVHNLIEQGAVKLDRSSVIKEAYSTPFILPRQHNSKQSIMRYFSTVFMEAKDFWNYSGSFKELRKHADGLIIYLISDCYEDTVGITERLNQLHLSTNILVCVADAWKDNQIILEYQAARLLESQNISDDSHFKEELQIYIYDLYKTIREISDEIYSPSNPNTAYYNADTCFDNITKPMLLNRELSTICDEYYSQSPCINNEMVNKNRITTQIRKARAKTIDWIFSHPDTIPPMDRQTSQSLHLCH